MTEKKKAIEKVTYLGMIINSSLAILKITVGIIGNSQAVIADAVHSLSDLVSDIALLIGVKFWDVPPDENHPYGHKKIESVVTLFIGIILTSVGIKLLYSAIITMWEGGGKADSSQSYAIALLGPFFSILIKEILYRITMKVGQKYKSSATIANAWHHRSDSLSSIPALVAVGVAVIYPEFAFVDKIGAIVVSAFIFKVAYSITRPAFDDLTDRTANREIVSFITSKVITIADVKSFHKVRARNAAGSYFVDLHIQVDGQLSVDAGHTISTDVKKTLLNSRDEIVDVLVHLEPYSDN